MVKEATIESTEHGKVATTDGWYALHASEVPWYRSPRFGMGARFEGEARFPETGVHLRVLEPGKPACLYHRENAQEDFYVVSGECTLIVEGEERALRAGHFVHCPAQTDHLFVGAGEGPCVVLMIGHRPNEAKLFYPVNEVAGRYDGSAVEDTPDPRQAYGERVMEFVDPIWPLYGED